MSCQSEQRAKERIREVKRETDKERNYGQNIRGSLQDTAALKTSLINTKCPNSSRHDPIIAQTEKLLRSSVDLIHYDCYTNGINKGKIAILKRRILILFIWPTLSPFSSSYITPLCGCACVWSHLSVSMPLTM